MPPPRARSGGLVLAGIAAAGHWVVALQTAMRHYTSFAARARTATRSELTALAAEYARRTDAQDWKMLERPAAIWPSRRSPS